MTGNDSGRRSRTERGSPETDREIPAAHARVELIPAQRHARLLEVLRVRRAASIRDLVELLGGSASTIRRDLEYLAELGALTRTFGGAAINASASTTFEPDSDIAVHLERAEKELIGRYAAGLISANESVIFDSSSTVLEAARAFVERGVAATAVTNDLGIARVLNTAPSLRLVVLGGTVRPRSGTLMGEPAERLLGDLHTDLALVGTHAITGDVLTETSIDLARVKRAMIHAARRTFVLADHTKFREPAFATICRTVDVTGIVTTRKADAAALARMREAGLDVRLADA
jgi:DeoR family transcriptional regulator, aga operon transcriptional repressor